MLLVLALVLLSDRNVDRPRLFNRVDRPRVVHIQRERPIRLRQR